MTIDFEEHLVPGDICIVAFAAGSQDVFQFGRVLRSLSLSHVLMRDSTRSWYQRGVAGIGDRGKVATYIRDLASHYYVKTAGVSSGAYAALLYGHLAGVDEIIAISALTTGTSVDDLDPQWHHRVAPDPVTHLQIDDLKKVLQVSSRPCVKAFVSDGDDTVLDAHMSRRLGVEPTLIAGHSHSSLARHMRDCGLLAELLKDRYVVYD